MRAVILSIAVLVSACGRWAGPHEEEMGLLTYWLLLDGTSSRAPDCSDGLEAEKIRLDAPLVGGSIAWYIIYRVEPGLDSAVAYTCDGQNAWEPANCRPLPEALWRIEDHVATLKGRFLAFKLRQCDIVVDYDSTVIDDGVEGQSNETLTFHLVGAPDACEAATRKLQADSPNGQGLEGCVLKREARLAFSRAVTKMN